MKRPVALITALALLFTAVLALFSCGESSSPDTGNNPTTHPSVSDYEFIVPTERDYMRGTVDFSDIEYSRPDVESLISDLERITELINDNEIEYEKQLDEIDSALSDYYTFLTMSTYAEIMLYRGDAKSTWSEEYEFCKKSYHELYDAIENMCVAAAVSPNAERFESEYFGDGFVEEYADGGFYTDALVLLFQKEEELITNYNSLTLDSFIITYNGRNGTMKSILAFYEELYTVASLTYKTAYAECQKLATAAYNDAVTYILTELFKVRRKIADELRVDSYVEYAYSTIYHDYSAEQFLDYLDDVTENVMPIYRELYSHVFDPFFESYVPEKEITKYEAINDLYFTYNRTDSELVSIYSYMLQHELFDCEEYDTNRFEGAFTTYLYDYEAPYLFATMLGTADDYLTISHEFGHFVDSYTNYGADTSLDLTEVYSTAMEMLAARALKSNVSEDEYKFLTYSAISSAFNAIISQGFYARFEHYAYELEYDEINEENLIESVKKAARDMNLDDSTFNSLDYVLIPHIILYPFYVQSYCTSSAVALEIYSMEIAESGSGLEAYMTLLERENDESTFDEYLKAAKLTSPFDDKMLVEVAKKIYYDIMGSHYSEEIDPSTKA